MDKMQLQTHGDLQESIQTQNGHWEVKWIRIEWPTPDLDEFLNAKKFGVVTVPLVISLRYRHYDVAIREDVCKAFETEFEDQIRPRLSKGDRFVDLKGSYDAIQHTIKQFTIAMKEDLWSGQEKYLNEEIQRLEASVKQSTI